ncbi:hypothetical protein RSD66_04360 [Brevundimonas sp. S1H14]|uniref:hypothetical protein n=1 Tax=Brevundimonas sp. S1H14 TaxID=3078084 RepID=UPI0039E996B7
MAARLKLFEWSDGFHTFTVAASSRPKALVAWGSGQDLFATGLAKEVHDSPGAAAAKASPGRVVERRLDVKLPAGSPNTGAAEKAKQPSAADRKRVEDAQLALNDLDTMHGQAARRLDEELQALRARRDEERTAYEAQREKLEDRLEKALAKF